MSNKRMDESVTLDEEMAEDTVNSKELSKIEKTINAFHSKCKLLKAEVELCVDCIQAAEESNDVDAAKIELNDLTRLETDYFEAYKTIVQLLEEHQLPVEDIFSARREFGMLVKNTKARASHIINRTHTSSNLEPATKRIKFGKIEFAPFTGKKEDWVSFRKLFMTYIHDSAELSLLEKHQFLCSKLKGEPAALIEALPIDGSSFERAWEILLHHYDDPLKRVSRHLDAMFKTSAVKGPQLRSLITQFRAQFTALTVTVAENSEIDLLSQFAIHLFLMKADKTTRLEWEKEVEKLQKFVPFDQFIQFMEGRCNAYERANSYDGNQTQKGQVLLAKRPLTENQFKCFYCNELNHRTHQCPKFLNLSIYERNQSIRRRRLCPKCFRGKCNRSCQYKCSQCNGHHNSLLHFEKKISPSNADKEKVSNLGVEAQNSAEVPNNNNKSKSLFSFNISCSLSEFANNYINCWSGHLNYNSCPLLATALIFADTKKKKNREQLTEVRTLLDPGSHFNLISKNLVNELRLNSISSNYNIFSIDNVSVKSKSSVQLKIKSRVNNFSLKIECIVIEKISDEIPPEKLSIEGWHFPKHLTLADPYFNIPKKVELLLGTGVFWKILKPQTMEIKNLVSPIFASQFGWVVAGEIKNNINNKNFNFLCTDVNVNDINETLKKLGFLGSENITNENLTFEELACENHFIKTYEREANGAFIVSLPMKISKDQLGESKPQALRRFYALEKKLDKNIELKLNYQKCIEDYLEKHQMEKVNDFDSQVSYYIPHRVVIRDESTTSKIRIVFDASEPTSTGLSLNDCLMTGPIVQSDLFSILIRSRMYKFIFSADISQMYRQIKVHKNDRPLLKILWRNNSLEKIQTFQLTTVPHGLSSSPYLATRCLKLLAESAERNFFKGKHAILNDCYVDNLFTGADSFDETLEILNQVSFLFEKGQFYLKKWCSNDENLLRNIPTEDLEKKFPCYFGNEMVIKTLGMIWDPKLDVFKIWVHIKNENLPDDTKRKILSTIASIFDPFGVLAPFIIKTKIFIQNLWKLKLDWDDILPENFIHSWSNIIKGINLLEHISIPRHVKLSKPECIEIHGFSDASNEAYGGAIYIRSVSNNVVLCHLLCAKTKVAPLKKISTARLELCGALVLIELLYLVKNSLSEIWPINIIRLWCDNQISLCWINSNPSKWLPFVANRVKKIQDKQGTAIWDYIRSEYNPADLLSRGLSAEQLKDNKFWWHGPKFLTANTAKFTDKVEFQPSKVQPLEIRQSRKILSYSLSSKSSYFTRFSNYIRLVRVTAYVQRFIWNAHEYGPFLSNFLQPFELKQAIVTLIKLVQSEYFQSELKILQRFGSIEKSSRLISLNPFLDAQNIIRVGGRLKSSNLSYEQKFPIVLPNNHTFTKLLIRYEHERNFHSGIQSMRSILRRNYWVLRQDTAIQHCILNCVKCIRLKGDIRNQMMSSLPRARVIPAKVFENVGIDYAGPIKLLIRRGKGGKNSIQKAYIAVFVCFATKAIHLELVSDLTSDAFLAAFDRFVGRRGLPVNIWSDNGTTFVGANKKLKEIFELFKREGNLIASKINMLGCNWHFIPPHSPHFGGLWEAGVKSVKHLLLRSIGETVFSYEQYETFLIKIEACLNSRPLCRESSDPNEINALTPGHFLVGGPLTSVPNPDLSEVPINRLKYWQLTTKKMQEFWKRWSLEYLNQLQQRNKWQINKNEVKIGDIVILKEDNILHLHWPLAQIVEIHPGNDGIVRVVTIKMRTSSYDDLKNKTASKIKFSFFKRPVSKLIYLPDPAQSS